MNARPQRVALVHYHLRGGGVTRVLQHICSALDAQGTKTTVLVGEAPPPDTPLAARSQVVPALAYGTTPDRAGDPTADLLAAARAGLEGLPDLWHIHNHSLGKNAVLPHLVQALAKRGERCLLQIHDFAEDGRPREYAFLTEHLATESDSPALYPAASHIHYATLNRRDRGFLLKAGLAPERAHCLPNAVALAMPSTRETTRITPGARRYLYPTRAIRRKNLGEFLLWSATAEAGEEFEVTLAPQNPAARPVYDRWVAVVRELALPVAFEVGSTSALSFPELLRRSHAVVTTSIAEGFGLAFLEPWVMRRPLLGRNLPEITADFAEEAIELGALYDRLAVPLDWLGEEPLRQRLAAGLGATWDAYKRTPPPGAVEEALAAAVQNETVDYGCLDEELQEQVLRRVAANPGAVQKLAPAALDGQRPGSQTVEDNRRRVEATWNLDHYGSLLRQTYETLLAAPTGPVEALDGAELLAQFLAPARFRLLRT